MINMYVAFIDTWSCLYVSGPTMPPSQEPVTERSEPQQNTTTSPQTNKEDLKFVFLYDEKNRSNESPPPVHQEIGDGNFSFIFGDTPSPNASSSGYASTPRNTSNGSSEAPTTNTPLAGSFMSPVDPASDQYPSQQNSPPSNNVSMQLPATAQYNPPLQQIASQHHIEQQAALAICQHLQAAPLPPAQKGIPVLLFPKDSSPALPPAQNVVNVPQYPQDQVAPLPPAQNGVNVPQYTQDQAVPLPPSQFYYNPYLPWFHPNIAPHQFQPLLTQNHQTPTPPPQAASPAYNQVQNQANQAPFMQPQNAQLLATAVNQIPPPPSQAAVTLYNPAQNQINQVPHNFTQPQNGGTNIDIAQLCAQLGGTGLVAATKEVVCVNPVYNHAPMYHVPSQHRQRGIPSE